MIHNTYPEEWNVKKFDFLFYVTQSYDEAFLIATFSRIFFLRSVFFL